MDEFEKFIQKHRSSLDVEETPNHLLNELPHRATSKKKSTTQWLMIAASFASIGLAIWLWNNSTVDQPEQYVEIKENDQELRMAQAQIKQWDSFYQEAIEFKAMQVNSTPLYAKDTAYFKVFLQQLKTLDEQNDFYLETVEDVGPHPKVMQEIVHYYQYKLQVLGRLIQEMEKVNTSQNLATNEEPIYIQL